LFSAQLACFPIPKVLDSGTTVTLVWKEHGHLLRSIRSEKVFGNAVSIERRRREKEAAQAKAKEKKEKAKEKKEGAQQEVGQELLNAGEQPHRQRQQEEYAKSGEAGGDDDLEEDEEDDWVDEESGSEDEEEELVILGVGGGRGHHRDDVLGLPQPTSGNVGSKDRRDLRRLQRQLKLMEENVVWKAWTTFLAIMAAMTAMINRFVGVIRSWIPAPCWSFVVLGALVGALLGRYAEASVSIGMLLISTPYIVLVFLVRSLPVASWLTTTITAFLFAAISSLLTVFIFLNYFAPATAPAAAPSLQPLPPPATRGGASSRKPRKTPLFARSTLGKSLFNSPTKEFLRDAAPPKNATSATPISPPLSAEDEVARTGLVVGSPAARKEAVVVEEGAEKEADDTRDNEEAD
jgi:hypothetical protein